MSSQILLYSGPGAGNFCTQSLENQIKEICDDRIYTIFSIQSFSSLPDPRFIKALFVPGGNAGTMWARSDLRQVSSLVKDIIDQHQIAYYGACAGGIIATSSFHSEIPKDDPRELGRFSLKKHAFLSLFPGSVVAPLFPTPFSEKRMINIEDFRIHDIELLEPTENTFLQSAHIFSPGYLNVSEIEGAQILGNYTHLPPFKIGKFEETLWQDKRIINPSEISESVFYQRPDRGPILLTGSHPEIDSRAVRLESFKEAFQTTKEKQTELADLMEPQDESRKALLKRNFEKINISCK